MMNGNVAGFQLERNGTTKINPVALRTDAADKQTILVVVENGFAVRAWDDHHTTAFQSDVFQGNADCAEIVVRVRMMSKVLVPFNRAAAVAGFEVDLVSKGPDVWSD